MNIKYNQRRGYQLCQQKLGPNQTLNYFISNQTRSMSGTAQSTNDAPTFTEPGTVTGHLTTVLQKAACAGLSLHTYTEMASLQRQRGSRAKDRPHPKAVHWTKPFSAQTAIAGGCPSREASRGISALPTERHPQASPNPAIM